MLEAKDKRIAELEAEVKKLHDVKNSLVDIIAKFTNPQIINGGEVLLVNKMEKERDRLRELCREMRSELSVHDCTRGVLRCRICSKLEKADAILEADNE